MGDGIKDDAVNDRPHPELVEGRNMDLQRHRELVCQLLEEATIETFAL